MSGRKFLYGTHYSAPGYVLYFLVRSGNRWLPCPFCLVVLQELRMLLCFMCQLLSTSFAFKMADLISQTDFFTGELHLKNRIMNTKTEGKKDVGTDNILCLLSHLSVLPGRGRMCSLTMLMSRRQVVRQVLLVYGLIWSLIEREREEKLFVTLATSSLPLSCISVSVSPSLLLWQCCLADSRILSTPWRLLAEHAGRQLGAVKICEKANKCLWILISLLPPWNRILIQE